MSSKLKEMIELIEILAMELQVDTQKIPSFAKIPSIRINEQTRFSIGQKEICHGVFAQKPKTYPNSFYIAEGCHIILEEIRFQDLENDLKYTIQNKLRELEVIQDLRNSLNYDLIDVF